MKKNTDKVTVSERMDFCQQILSGALHLYKHGVVHFDLKPTNIAIDITKNYKRIMLIDFGTAKVFQHGATLDFSLHICKGDNIHGNLIHRAPELLQQLRELDRSPLQIGKPRPMKILNVEKQPSFAVGVLCYTILCGHEPLDLYPDIITPTSFADVQDKVLLEHYGQTWRDVVMGLLLHSPQERLSLAKAATLLNIEQFSLKHDENYPSVIDKTTKSVKNSKPTLHSFDLPIDNIEQHSAKKEEILPSVGDKTTKSVNNLNPTIHNAELQSEQKPVEEVAKSKKVFISYVTSIDGIVQSARDMQQEIQKFGIEVNTSEQKKPWNAIADCDLFIVFGSESYACEKSCRTSTYRQYCYAQSIEKSFAWVKMCHRLRNTDVHVDLCTEPNVRWSNAKNAAHWVFDILCNDSVD